MLDVVPTFDWYKHTSEELRLPVHCPYAHVRRCPRYFYSRSLLGKYGGTEIGKEEDKELTRFWEGSDAAPVTAEDGPSVTQSGEKHPSFWKFCPEVLHDRFGWFVSDLAAYADEIDQEAAYNFMKAKRICGGHPNWTWSVAEPMHYTNCSTYSLLPSNLPEVHKREERVGTGLVVWWKRNEVIGWIGIGVTILGTIALFL